MSLACILLVKGKHHAFAPEGTCILPVEGRVEQPLREGLSLRGVISSVSCVPERDNTARS